MGTTTPESPTTGAPTAEDTQETASSSAAPAPDADPAQPVGGGVVAAVAAAAEELAATAAAAAAESVAEVPAPTTKKKKATPRKSTIKKKSPAKQKTPPSKSPPSRTRKPPALFANIERDKELDMLSQRSRKAPTRLVDEGSPKSQATPSPSKSRKLTARKSVSTGKKSTSTPKSSPAKAGQRVLRTRSPKATPAKARPVKKQRTVKAATPVDRKARTMETYKNAISHSMLRAKCRPTEKIEGFDEYWPNGWVQVSIGRKISDRKAQDSYWFSPKNRFKFRSLKNVEKFLNAMKKNNGDEVLSYEQTKEGKR